MSESSISVAYPSSLSEPSSSGARASRRCLAAAADADPLLGACPGRCRRGAARRLPGGRTRGGEPSRPRAPAAGLQAGGGELAELCRGSPAAAGSGEGEGEGGSLSLRGSGLTLAENDFLYFVGSGRVTAKEKWGSGEGGWDRVEGERVKGGWGGGAEQDWQRMTA